MAHGTEDPIEWLIADRARARAARDPMADLCVLATVDGDEPHARTLVLRDVEGRPAVFMNATSPKHAQITVQPRVAIVVYLASCAVQYRLNGMLEPIARTIVHGHWRARPRIPKVMDWFYREHTPQSAVIDSRASLESGHATLDARLGVDPLAPEEAMGHYIVAETVDRLALASDRIHERTRFSRVPQGWRCEILVP
jgi:pyridoxine/pyridoxamine 5'-phosphate oxidase